VTWTCGKERKKERKKKEKKLKRCDKSHMCQCPDHHVVYPTKVVMWRVIPYIVNHAKFRQNWLSGFGSLRGRNLPFSYTQRYSLYRPGYCPTCDSI